MIVNMLPTPRERGRGRGGGLRGKGSQENINKTVYMCIYVCATFHAYSSDNSNKIPLFYFSRV